MSISVLVVEDLPDLADVMTVFLRRARMDVLAVSTGCVALRTWRSRQTDIVLLDRSLPDMDGTETAARMRDDGFRGAILIVSGHQGKDHVEACILAGADGVIAKPFKMSDLVERVRTSVERRTLAAV